MQPLRLTDDLLTGNPAIDRQHRALFEHANQVLFPETPQEIRRTEIKTLLFLKAYIGYHFAAEETAMLGLEMDFDGHRAQHTRLYDRVAEILHRAEGKIVLSDDERAAVHTVLHQWLTQHIGYWDRLLAEALQRAGRAEDILPEPAGFDRLEIIEFLDEDSPAPGADVTKIISMTELEQLFRTAKADG